MHVRVYLSRFRTYQECPSCHGLRLRPEALQFKVGGRSMPELSGMPHGRTPGLGGSIRHAARG